MSANLDTCCVCVEKCLYVENITEIDSNNVKYVDKLKICLPNTEEDWSNNFVICNACIEKLEITYEFLNLCIKSEQFRKGEILRIKEEINKLEEFDTSYEEKPDLILSEGLETDLSDNEVKLKKKTAKRVVRKKSNVQKTCEHCNITFLRTDKFVAHIRSKHTFEKPYKCDKCPSEYYSSHNLAIHKRKHTSEKPYICSTCGKRFISSNDLWQHNKIHKDTRDYVCDICLRRYKTHSNLRTHKVQMHLDPNEWKYICSTCGKKFPLKNNLLKHIKRHAGIKPFICHLCPKAFVEKIDLQTHLLSHSDERLFKCNLCVKEYKKNETLRRHLKVEHDIGDVLIKKPEKKLNCPMCPKLFAFNNKLNRHILTHTGEKPVSCKYCEKKFRDTYDRNAHMRKEHEDEINKESNDDFGHVF